MSKTQSFDVIVAGMGPVGKMIALMMARKGHSVLISDKKSSPYVLPRAVAYDAEIARVLQSVNLRSDSMPDSVEPYDDMYVWVNANDEILHLVDWTGIDPSGWNNVYFYNQPGLERHIDDRMREQKSLEAVRGASVVVTGQDADGVDAELVDVESGAVRKVRAKYLLGADGANSETRRSVDIRWNDLGYFFDWLVVDVIPGPGSNITHLARQVADPSRPTTVVPAGPGKRRWEFMLLDGEDPEEFAKPENVWKLLEKFDLNPGNAEIERGVVYRFGSGWAEGWRKRRVMLIGDAAHQMPPFAGQGLAAGFRDCINLAWKLDLVLKGKAKDTLLDTYSTERTPHVSDFINFSMELGKIICITDLDQAAARDAAMIADREAGRQAEPPPAPRLGDGLFTGDAGGYLSWQGQITVKGGPKSKFDDAFGCGALILEDGSLATDLSDADIDALESLGVVVVTFGTSSNSRIKEFVDADGTYATWLSMVGDKAVLVRPDLYVYGSGSSATEVATLATTFTAEVLAH
jgi:3-(3-hydroxy-phenyl)propionate hydroxylase